MKQKLADETRSPDGPQPTLQSLRDRADAILLSVEATAFLLPPVKGPDFIQDAAQVIRDLLAALPPIVSRPPPAGETPRLLTEEKKDDEKVSAMAQLVLRQQSSYRIRQRSHS